MKGKKRYDIRRVLRDLSGGQGFANVYVNYDVTDGYLAYNVFIERERDGHTLERKHLTEKEFIELVDTIRNEPCPAVIHHGPGHQSKTHCYLKGPHDVHETRYGSHDELARWRGDEVSSGFFDNPPDVED